MRFGRDMPVDPMLFSLDDRTYRISVLTSGQFAHRLSPAPRSAIGRARRPYRRKTPPPAPSSPTAPNPLHLFIEEPSTRLLVLCASEGAGAFRPLKQDLNQPGLHPWSLASGSAGRSGIHPRLPQPAAKSERASAPVRALTLCQRVEGKHPQSRLSRTYPGIGDSSSTEIGIVANFSSPTNRVSPEPFVQPALVGWRITRTYRSPISLDPRSGR